jgi:tetratricopeptide (TPR) repeat protein
MNSHVIAILHNEARRQAAKGNHSSSLDLLDQIPETAGATLRAKVLCQQGLFTKAAGFWRAALASDPEDQEAKRGLALTESMARSPLPGLRLHMRRWFLALVILIAAFLGTWIIAVPSGVSATRPLAASVETLERRVAALDVSSRQSGDALMQRIERSENDEALRQGQMQAQLQRVQQALRRLEKSAAESKR